MWSYDSAACSVVRIMILKTKTTHADEETNVVDDDDNVVAKDEFHDNFHEIHNTIILF